MISVSLAVLMIFPGASVAYDVTDYCDGSAILSREMLYTEPPCSQTVEQRPAFNTSIQYARVELENLAFCCTANYTALVPIGTDLDQLDAEARSLAEMADRFLHRYDCAQFYPFHSCEPCRRAYRTWACSTVFPMKCLGQTSALQVCDDVCLEVQRKCPPEMHFYCPMDDNTDDAGDGQYGRWTGGSDVQLFGRGGCNPMQYNLGPNSQFGSASHRTPFAFVALLAVLFLF